MNDEIEPGRAPPRVKRARKAWVRAWDMAVVICHGGLSTITAALAAGVPLICIPQGRDQHINAARVAASGVGRVVAPEASAAEIATALLAVILDRSARESARRFAEEVATLGGERATLEVEQLAG